MHEKLLQVVRGGQPGGSLPGGGTGGVPGLPEADEVGRHGGRLPAVRRQRQQLHGVPLHPQDVAGEKEGEGAFYILLKTLVIPIVVGIFTFS